MAEALTLSGAISPQDWGLPVYAGDGALPVPGLDVTAGEISRRIEASLYRWLPEQLDPSTGAFFGFYRPSDRYREPPQTVNLIASWLLMAAYDRYSDPDLLQRAVRALDFYFSRFVVSHPMSVVAGGGLDGVNRSEIWTKFSAEFAMGALGLYARTRQAAWLERARQSGRYLLQAARHGFAPKYRLDTGRWGSLDFGWDSWGRAIEACLGLWNATGEQPWRELALRWGEHALAIQGEDGSFYLIDQEYYNTDLAADELRGLAFLFELTRDDRYLHAARRFADWHLSRQRPDGAWEMTVDCDGNLVIPTVGPGDVPNIAISLLAMHRLTGQASYLDAAQGAFRYSLSKQVLPGSGEPYAHDPGAQWGFWSWDPYYDYTLSADQATHHVRGMMFLLDYLMRPHGDETVL